MVICHCQRVTSAVIEAAIERGADSVAEVTASCQAGTRCGSCLATIELLLAPSAA